MLGPQGKQGNFEVLFNELGSLVWILISGARKMREPPADVRTHMSRKWRWENMKHDQGIANLVFVVHRAPRE